MLEEMYINIDLDPIPEYVKLAGVSFYNRQDIVNNLHVGEILKLKRDYTNVHDKHATGAYNNRNEFVGWIPKYAVENLAKEIDNGIPWEAKIESITGSMETNKGVNVRLICKVD